MTIHVAGLVRFKGTFIGQQLVSHFKILSPAKGHPFLISHDFSTYTVIIAGMLVNLGEKDIPKLEAWFADRLAAIEDVNLGVKVIQAVLSAELESRHRFYTWIRGQDPGIKAVAMEAE